MEVSQRRDLLRAMKRLRNIHNWFNNICNIPQGEFIMLHKMDELNKASKNKHGLKSSELSYNCEMSKPAVSQMLNSLEKKEYIKREMTREDRRVVYVCLTQKGKEKLKDSTERFISGFDKIIYQLGKEDTEVLIELLNKLYRIIQNMQ